MEYILNSNDHKVLNNCLRDNFRNPIRFINQKISLMSIIFITILRILQINLLRVLIIRIS